MAASPIAVNTAESKEQHYEVPTRFYELCLGRRLKYSSAYYDATTRNLDEAEERMLGITAQRAGIKNGDKVLELGCGWGSLTLYLAENFPKSKITASATRAPSASTSWRCRQGPRPRRTCASSPPT